MYVLKSLNENQDISINKSVITIGRDESNDIIISDSTVSSFHAKIYLEDNSIYLEDLNSTNGTYINNFQIESSNQYELSISDKVLFGQAKYTLEKESQQNISNNNEFTIGRAVDADYYINVDTVSRYHLTVKQESGTWYIIDNNSTNGTYLNSYDNRITKIELQPNQLLFLATYRLNTNEIYNLINNNLDKKETILSNDTITIGRDPASDIYINNLNVSWNHAKIVNENGQYVIYDLNSTNGTYVNDVLVKKSISINPGDKIALGTYSFIFKEDKKRNYSIVNVNNKGFTIEAKDVIFKVNTGTQKEKTLIDNISLTVYPGELVGLMGLSGAGKTTLLKILSGYTRPTEGKVYVNGIDLYKNFDRIKNTIGYVPQDDIMHPELTVYEALVYSVKLRIKDKLSQDEIDKKIDDTLEDLGLLPDNNEDKEKFKNTKIGDAENKYISGGQRKRVNIAMELLADPDILFLDEPTSGLSSVDAKIVMEKLEKLSKRGKTIILTIHQPSLINYKKMDNMIILTHGKLAYFGPNYPESIKFFNKNSDSEDTINDPDMALIGLYNGEENGIDWQDNYKKSNLYETFVQKRTNEKKSIGLESKNNSPSPLKQFSTLVLRYFSIKMKDKVNTAILLLQAPVIALLLGFLFASGTGIHFYKEHPSVLLFILVVSAMWFGIINSVKEIVGEKAIFERERQNGLGLAPYLFSKFIVLSLISLIQVLILIGIVDIFMKLHQTMNIFELIGVIYLTSLSGVAIGLLTSTIAKSVSQALSLVPIILLPMIIFGGGMMPIKDLPTNKLYLDAYRVSMLMPTRWALEEVVRIYDKGKEGKIREPKDNNGTKVFENEKVKAMALSGDEPTCEDRRCIETLYISDEDENRKYTFRTTPTYIIYILLGLFIVIPLGIVILVLYKRSKK